MKNLINFFFSFDKLMKEKLILPFFWLAVIVSGLWFFQTALDAIALGVLANVVNFFEFFVRIVLALVSIRLVSELAVALFRINDNLSPDGGKSETANIDPMAEARKVAEMAAERAREAAKTAGEKTQAATKSARESISGGNKSGNNSSSGDEAIQTDNGAKAGKSGAGQAAPSRKTAPKNPVAKSARVKAKPSKSSQSKTKASPSTRTKSPIKPSGSKPKTKGSPNAAPKKRGPKAGVKMRRDAQGRLLKKDGTLRAKPGPKKS